MTIIELKAILTQEGIDEKAYELEGGMPTERYTLSKEGRSWCVYYSERGLQTGKKFFDLESDACRYLLDQLRADPTARSSS